MFCRELCVNNFHKTMSTSIVDATCKIFNMLILSSYSRFMIIDDHLQFLNSKHLYCETISLSYSILSLWTIFNITSSPIDRFWTIYFILFLHILKWIPWSLLIITESFFYTEYFILTTTISNLLKSKFYAWKFLALCFTVFKLLTNNYC